MVSFYKIVLVSILFLVSVSGVCAVDPDNNNNDSLTTVEDNSLQLNNYTVLSASNVTSDNVNNLTDNDNNRVINDSSNLSTVPCAVSSYISIMESYNKTVDVETGIKETHTVNNVTSVNGLVNALTNQGLKCNVIKTKSIENLKELHKDKRHNIILHMFIKNNYHYGHIKEIRKNGILFNNNLFVPSDLLNLIYTNISIIISKENFLNINRFGEIINRSEWVNITGKLSEKELFKYNIGLIDTSIISYSKYSKLKENIKDNDTKKGIAFLENALFGDTLKPKMANVLTIKKKLKPVIADSNVPDNLLRNFNNALTPMQKNLNETISSLDYLINMIKKLNKNKKNLKSSKAVVSHSNGLNVPKLLDDGVKLFVNNLKESINNLNPLNAHPELREKYDKEYDLEHHTLFGFIDYYTIKR